MARLIFLTLTRIIIQGGLTSTLSVSGVAGLMGDRMNQSGCGWLQTSQKVKTKRDRRGKWSCLSEYKHTLRCIQ